MIVKARLPLTACSPRFRGGGERFLRLAEAHHPLITGAFAHRHRIRHVPAARDNPGGKVADGLSDGRRPFNPERIQEPIGEGGDVGRTSAAVTSGNEHHAFPELGDTEIGGDHLHPGGVGVPQGLEPGEEVVGETAARGEEDVRHVLQEERPRPQIGDDPHKLPAKQVPSVIGVTAANPAQSLARRASEHQVDVRQAVDFPLPCSAVSEETANVARQHGDAGKVRTVSLSGRRVDFDGEFNTETCKFHTLVEAAAARGTATRHASGWLRRDCELGFGSSVTATSAYIGGCGARQAGSAPASRSADRPDTVVLGAEKPLACRGGAPRGACRLRG